LLKLNNANAFPHEMLRIAPSLLETADQHVNNKKNAVGWLLATSWCFSETCFRGVV